MFSRIVLTCATAALALTLWSGAQAQMLDRVVAVINDEAISYRDVEARVRLALVSSNIPDSQEARQRVVPQVLRKMIDERLQVQEAQRLGIVLSNADVDGAIATVEQQSRMPRGITVQSGAARCRPGPGARTDPGRPHLDAPGHPRDRPADPHR